MRDKMIKRIAGVNFRVKILNEKCPCGQNLLALYHPKFGLYTVECEHCHIAIDKSCGEGSLRKTIKEYLKSYHK
jgi:hypothetical protein